MSAWLHPFSPWVAYLGADSLRAIPLILLLWGFQRLTRRWIAPGWMKMLWLLVLVRLFLPDLVASRASVYGWPSRLPSEVIHSVEVAGNSLPIASSLDSTTDSSVASKNWDTIQTLTALWLLGVIALSGAMVWQAWRFHRRFAGLRPCTDPALLELLEDAKERARLWTPVSLVVSESISAPTLYGFFRPRLLVPVALTRALSHEEMDCVFQHELAHINAWDIALNWLVSFTVVLHWFNPFVWLMARQMARTRELACDRAVLSQRNDPQVYGEVILRAAESLHRPHLVTGVVGIVENKNNLRERIEMLTHTYGKRTGFVAFGTALLVATLFLSDPIRGDSAAPDYAAMGAAVRAERRENIANALKAANAWMTLFDAQKYSDCPVPRHLNNSVVTPDRWMKYIVATYPPFGTFQSREQVNISFSAYGQEAPLQVKGPLLDVGYGLEFKSEDGTVRVGIHLVMTRRSDGSWQVENFSDSYLLR